MKSGPAATVLLLCKPISQEDTLITHHGLQAAGADRKVIGGLSLSTLASIYDCMDKKASP